jgi:hypothetical protein
LYYRTSTSQNKNKSKDYLRFSLEANGNKRSSSK